MQPIHVLIVDDEPDILEFLSYNFRKKGFAVTTARNGIEGINATVSHSPDLIISDILMPEMDGIEMCKALRKTNQGKEIPFVFLTAVNDEYKVMYAMDSGADQYAAKPIRFDYLLNIVTELYLNKKRA